jgi:hypothetical protein
MIFYKMDDENIHYRCSCGVCTSVPFDSVEISGEGIGFNACECGRRGGVFLAGLIADDAGNLSRHVINQTLAKRLIAAGRLADNNMTSVDKAVKLSVMGKEWKNGMVMEVSPGKEI